MKLSIATTVLASLFAITAGAGAENGSHEGDCPDVSVKVYSAMKPPPGNNPCEGTKPPAGAGFDNFPCGDIYQTVNDAIEMKDTPQAGANVTDGYVGLMNVTQSPITIPYYQAGLCPVNVHWHLGAEHLSVGEYDASGTGPDGDHRQRALAGNVRLGNRCNKYNADDVKFTGHYDWKYCKGMKVGETYEVHWPHSAFGACGTPNQYQLPFYDGVFCHIGTRYDTSKDLSAQVGVQAQVFTIVNDEAYYYPDMMGGMIVDGEYGMDIASYTGSTTGTSRNNTICSAYSPITWQVDRKCQLISASSFDKMCGDMMAVRDDMTDDLYAHGSREVVASEYAANNQVDYQSPP